MSGQTAESWCVLGGGMLGQALALELARAGKRVTVCEAAPETGGLASAWEIDGITWDRHYHVILPGDRRTLALMDEIGLGDEVRWAKSRTGFFGGGRLSPLDSSIDYLRLPGLGLIAKARLAYTLMRAARIADGKPLERISVKDWLTRMSGRTAFEKLWRPLLRAKLGANDEVASAAFIWSTIRRLYLARSSGAKTETLGFVEGGYARILDALGKRLAEAGVEVLTSCPVQRVAPQGGRFLVETASGPRHFDRVVSTLAAGPTARVCAELSPELKERLGKIVYQGILCASVVLDRPLEGYYLTYLTDADMPFTAVVEMSSLTGTAPFGGKTLVYLPRYVTQDDPYWQLSDDEVKARFLDGLRRVHPDVTPEQISAFRLSRVRNVMAVPTVGYADIVPPVETNVPGFYIANSAQIADGTLNVDATLGVAAAALPRLLQSEGARNVRTAA